MPPKRYISLAFKRNEAVANERQRMRAPWGDIAPRLAEITDTVLFGEVWRRKGLSQRDRSLITVACLIALYRTNQLPFHLGKAIENGVTHDEPTASTALGIARQTLFATEQDPSKGSENGNA